MLKLKIKFGNRCCGNQFFFDFMTFNRKSLAMELMCVKFPCFLILPYI